MHHRVAWQNQRWEESNLFFLQWKWVPVHPSSSRSCPGLPRGEPTHPFCSPAPRTKRLPFCQTIHTPSILLPETTGPLGSVLSQKIDWLRNLLPIDPHNQSFGSYTQRIYCHIFSLSLWTSNENVNNGKVCVRLQQVPYLVYYEKENDQRYNLYLYSNVFKCFD